MPFIIFLSILLLLLLGPREKVARQVDPVSLPDDLDAFLRQSERCFDDIVPGAEKEILWAGARGAQTEYAIVYLHGFSASRQETAPLSDRVAKTLGANLFYTRFAGHGRDGAALGAATANAWLADTAEALAIGRRIGRRLIFICVSTGATMATWLAAQADVADIAALVYISPNFGPRAASSSMLTWPWGAFLARLAIGPEVGWEARTEDHGRYWTNRYPTRALVPMMTMVKLVDRLDLSRVSAPLLTIYSPNDQVINVRNVEKTFVRFGSSVKKLIPYSRSRDANNHVIAGDLTSPETTADFEVMILDFLNGIDVYPSA